MTIQEVLKRDNQFKYMLLGRMQQDCDFYLGFGSRNPSKLWALDESEHIAYMEAIWNNLEEKPDWLSFEKITEYKNLMGVS